VPAWHLRAAERGAGFGPGSYGSCIDRIKPLARRM
jgi:hypothetical protein